MLAGPTAHIPIPTESITALCRRRRVRRLALFGSVLRDDFRPDSDIDMLVEFAEDARVGLFDMADMEADLATILGRRVDLRTPAELSRYFRDEVLRSSRAIYAASA